MADRYTLTITFKKRVTLYEVYELMAALEDGDYGDLLHKFQTGSC